MEGWLEWANQYRNMFVHRGRRITYNQIVRQNVVLFNAEGQVIPRATSNLHLAKYPDRSEIEALIKGKDILLNEAAEVTLNGIFKSSREFEEHICERLLSIWRERRNNPTLIEQPVKQWNNKPEPCNFIGYKPDSEQVNADGTAHPVFLRRMLSASVDNDHRSLWAKSKWDQ